MELHFWVVIHCIGYEIYKKKFVEENIIIRTEHVKNVAIMEKPILNLRTL